MFGRANWKQSFLAGSKPILESMCDGVAQSKVIPLLTQRPSVPVAAEHAALARLFNTGRIHRICVSHHVPPGYPDTTIQSIISRLKAIFPAPNVIFSGRFSRPGRALIFVSYSNETEKPLAA